MVLLAFGCTHKNKTDFCEKYRESCTKVFVIAGMERPSDKVTYLGRMLGMNRSKECWAAPHGHHFAFRS